MTKLVKRCFCLLFLLSTFSGAVFSDDFDLDDIVIDDLGVDQSVLSNEVGTKGATVSDDEEQALLFLADLIKDPLWKTTRPQRGRDPLYLMTSSLREPCFKGLNLNLFYNFTNKMPTTLGDTFGISFRDESQKEQLFDLIAQLVRDEKKGTDANAEDMAALLPMFENLWVQERKAGFLTRVGINLSPFNLRLEMPLLLSERNLMTTKEDQDRINEIIEFNLGSFDTSFSKEREFARMRIGIGDIRASLDTSFICYSDFKVCGGLSVIIPTATGILLDGKWKKPIEGYTLDDSLVDMLNNARKMLLDPELGNRGHFGFGAHIESRLKLCQDTVCLWGRISYEDLFTSNEDRLIMSKRKIEDPNILVALGDPTDQELTDFKYQYVVPKEYDVKVKPGGVFNFACMADFRWGHWLLGVGYDYYLRDRETFEIVYDNSVNMNSLRISDAAIDRAYQHKLASELSYDVNLKDSKLNFGIGGEATISHRNLGDAWTIYSKVNINF